MDKKEDHHVNAGEVAALSDLTQLMNQDNTPWYRKRNLRSLYLFLVPSALGVSMTAGYDGSVLNGLQAVKPWQNCMYYFWSAFRRDVNEPR